jgi:hypothetical protein
VKYIVRFNQIEQPNLYGFQQIEAKDKIEAIEKTKQLISEDFEAELYEFIEKVEYEEL